MNGMFTPDILARLPSLPRLAGAIARLRARPVVALPLYRSEGFGEDLEAFDVQYRPRPRATIMRRQTAAEERKQ